MLVNQLKIEIPDLFLGKKVNQETFNNLSNASRDVQERLYLLANNVKKRYIWAELVEGIEGYSLIATLTPRYNLVGEAKEQAKLLGIFDKGPGYKIKMQLFNLFTNSEELKVTSLVSNKKDVASVILEKIKIIEDFSAKKEIL